MRMMTVYINKKPVSFQVSLRASVRFSHLNEKDVTDGTQVQIQNWDKRQMQERKKPSYVLPKLF